MTCWPLYINASHTPIHCMHLFVPNSTLLHPLVMINKNIIHVGLFIIWLYLMCASEGLTYWMTLEFNSYDNLEVSYIFCKVPTSIWLLVNVINFLCYLYNFQVQPYIHGKQWSDWWTWLVLSSDWHSGNHIVWTFITSIDLNLGIMSDYTYLYIKHLLSSWL